MITTEVLGIGVDELLVERWRGWFAPSVQPFRTDVLPDRVAAGIPMKSAEPTPEWRDTFFMYGGTWTLAQRGRVQSASNCTGEMLPGAQETCGHFSGPAVRANCFGTVMAAAGVDGASVVQIGTDSFQTWLNDSTESITTLTNGWV